MLQSDAVSQLPLTGFFHESVHAGGAADATEGATRSDAPVIANPLQHECAHGKRTQGAAQGVVHGIFSFSCMNLRLDSCQKSPPGR